MCIAFLLCPNTGISEELKKQVFGNWKIHGAIGSPVFVLEHINNRGDTIWVSSNPQGTGNVTIRLKIDPSITWEIFITDMAIFVDGIGPFMMKCSVSKQEPDICHIFPLGDEENFIRYALKGSSIQFVFNQLNINLQESVQFMGLDPIQGAGPPSFEYPKEG